MEVLYYGEVDPRLDEEWCKEMRAVLGQLLKYDEELHELQPPRTLFEVQAEVDLMADHEKLGISAFQEWLDSPDSDYRLLDRAMREWQAAEGYEARAVALLESLGY